MSDWALPRQIEAASGSACLILAEDTRSVKELEVSGQSILVFLDASLVAVVVLALTAEASPECHAAAHSAYEIYKREIPD